VSQGLRRLQATYFSITTIREDLTRAKIVKGGKKRKRAISIGTHISYSGNTTLILLFRSSMHARQGKGEEGKGKKKGKKKDPPLTFSHLSVRLVAASSSSTRFFPAPALAEPGGLPAEEGEREKKGEKNTYVVYVSPP